MRADRAVTKTTIQIGEAEVDATVSGTWDQGRWIVDDEAVGDGGELYPLSPSDLARLERADGPLTEEMHAIGAWGERN